VNRRPSLRSRGERAIAAVAVVAMPVSLGSCSGGDDAADTVPIPGQETTTSAVSMPPETSGSTTLATSPPPPTPPSAPTTTEPPSTTEPPGTAPPSAPVTTAAPTPSTLIPPATLETDPAAPANNRLITPEQQPIIDAYRAGIEVEQLTYTRWPLDPDSPDLLSGPFTAKALDAIEDGMVQRTALNQLLDVSGGLTLRPFVVEADDGDPTRVIVWDCQIDATFWKDKDSGEKAPPDAFPNAGPPGVEIGVAAALVNVDGRWLLDQGGLEPRACD
jgi:hypothetical protein